MKRGIALEAYFARQPILDSHLRLYGYELLFRPDADSLSSGITEDWNGDNATISVLDAANWAGIEKVTGGKYAFVNFTERLLAEGVATLFPREYLVVEILENVPADQTTLEALRAIKRKGYLIALDDYVYRKDTTSLLDLCDIVKAEADGSAVSYQNIRSISRAIQGKKCALLAEKVETQEVFERAKALGCTLFQGYFFAKPKLLAEKVVGALKMNQLRMMREVARPEMDFGKLSDIIKSDVGLTYRTLRLVNSAHYGLRSEVKSINQAVVLLGRDEMRKWLLVSSLCALCEDKPSELAIMSLTRAYFCEQAAKAARRARQAEAYFLAGLFSLLDVLTDTALETCLESMSVPAATKLALLGGNNAGRDMLDLIIALEQGNWPAVMQFSRRLRIGDGQLQTMYLDAIHRAYLFMV